MKPILFILLTAGILAVPMARAQLLSQESFTGYPVGTKLTGLGTIGSGYLGPWAHIDFGNGEPAVIAGSLVYGNPAYTAGIGERVGKGADTTGGNAGNSGRVVRLLDSSLTVQASTTGTRYLSWLYQTGNENAAPNANVYQTLGLYNASTADANRNFDAGIAAGDFATPNYAFRVKNNSALGGNLNVAPGTGVHLFVAKFQLSATAGGDSVTVWIDPVLGAGDPAGGVTVSGIDIQFDRLALSDYSSNSVNWDEIRWGASFNNVTVDPIVSNVPTFVVQPTNYSGKVGDTVTLTAGAVSEPVATYQWQVYDGSLSAWKPISGATASSYQIPSAPYSANGSYRVIATNANDSVTSDEASVSLVFPGPVISQQPASVNATHGDDVTLSVAATGIGNLTYQWYKGVTAIGGATSASLDLVDIQASNTGAYHVEIKDDAAVAEGLPAAVTVSNTAMVNLIEIQMTASATAPVTHASDRFFFVSGIDDVENIGGPGSTTSAQNDESTYVAPDRSSKGQTFTTGSNPAGYTLGSITVQHVQWGNFLTNGTAYDIQNNDTFKFQFGTMSGTTKTPIYTGTAAYSGSALVTPAQPNNLGTGNYFTFDLSGAGIATLSPDTTYYFEIASGDGAPYFELNGSATGDYTGGTAFRGNTGAEVGTIASGVNLLTGDFVFHARLVKASDGSDFASWIGGFPGVGTQTGFDQDADGDGIKNGLENFFGTDPSVSTKGITQVALTGDSLTFQHPQNAMPASDLSAAYRWSTDLVAFHGNGEAAGGTTVSFSSSPNTPVAGTTTVTAHVIGAIPAKLFVAVKVTQAE